jgi:hypothetical protein
MDPHFGGISPERCAYCGSVLPRNIEAVEAWRVGSRFVCNEFCADGIQDDVAAPSGLPVVAVDKRERGPFGF